MMRLAALEVRGERHVGVKSGDGYALTGYRDMIALIGDGAEGLRRAGEAARRGEVVRGARLLTPVANPSKILCSGINFAAHSEEDPDAKLPEKPSFFSKLPGSLAGPGDPIVLPEPDCRADYEVELTLVIGKRAKHVRKEDAFDCIFGYTVMNDVSGRTLQFGLQHETIGKGFDTFCPVGPEIVTKDDIPDPAKLRIRSYVNGQLRQDASMSETIFDIPTVIAFLTKYMTLVPGDLISMGTPSGCGTFLDPPVFLQPGDETAVEADGIGRLVNPVVAGWE